MIEEVSESVVLVVKSVHDGSIIVGVPYLSLVGCCLCWFVKRWASKGLRSSPLDSVLHHGPFCIFMNAQSKHFWRGFDAV